MKKRNVLKAGIVALVIAVLISTTTAVPLSNIKATQETYIDSNIHLTRKDLSWLIRSVPFIKNEDCKELTKKIIKILITKGTIDSEQIKQIITNSDYEITGIHTSCTIETNSPGDAFALPGLLRSFVFFISKGGLLSWTARYDIFGLRDINVKVGSETYTTPHEGLALGYFGLVANTNDFSWGIVKPCKMFVLSGFAALVLVY